MQYTKLNEKDIIKITTLKKREHPELRQHLDGR
jgi:hypothetical protein